MRRRRPAGPLSTGQRRALAGGVHVVVLVAVHVGETRPHAGPPRQVEHHVDPVEEPLQVELDKVADDEGDARGPHQAGSPDDLLDRVVAVGETVDADNRPALLHEPWWPSREPMNPATPVTTQRRPGLSGIPTRVPLSFVSRSMAFLPEAGPVDDGGYEAG